MSPAPEMSALQSRLQRDGFAFVKADAMRQLLDDPQKIEDWSRFTDSWNDLAPDTYLAATGRKRRRRHATFVIDANGDIRRQAQEPHYQSLQHNPLQGDIQRWFSPIQPAMGMSDSMHRILHFSHTLFDALTPAVSKWHVETHQFRIEASAGEAGQPTPEGIHHDGVDHVLVLLIDRENIESGTTTIHDGDGSLLGSFTLINPLDAALVDDARVSHGVTPVTPFDPAKSAHRDVLVVTFKAMTPDVDTSQPLA